MDARDWLTAFAQELGVAAPSEQELERLLELAGVAAHSSERFAAPIACWLVARADMEPSEALELAKHVGGEDG